MIDLSANATTNALNQKIIAEIPFSQEMIFTAFRDVFGPCQMAIVGVTLGNINLIVKMQVEGRFYGLRARVREDVYRYEPNLMKEAVVSIILECDPFQECDDQMKRLVSQVQPKGAAFSRAWGEIPFPKLISWDWTRKLIPYPFCIYEWVEGEPLWKTPMPGLYRQAGELLGRLHRFKFGFFHSSFSALDEVASPWSKRFQESFGKELGSASRYLPAKTTKKLREIEMPESEFPVPTLLHNDYSGANILVRDGMVVALIDWDNSIIEAPQLDFVKMKYWTRLGSNGILEHDSALYSAFQKGYMDLAGSPEEEASKEALAMTRLYEALWLCRVFNFEKSREERGLPALAGYPPSDFYALALEQIEED